MAKIDKIIVKENGIENKVDSIENKTIDLLRYYPGKVLNMSIKGNSSQDGTPTPETPIEIESVGKLGKNLCGGRNVLLDKLIGNSANGNIIDSTAYHTMFIEVEEGQTYSFTGFVRADGSSLKGCFYNSNKEWVAAFEETTVTIPSGVKYVGRSFNNTIKEVQFEKGEPTEYESYGYNIPIIVDKIDNKNLFGGYDTTLINVYIDASGNYISKEGINTYKYIKVEPNTTYTISGKSKTKGYIRVAQYDINKKFITRIYNSVMVNPRITITTTATTKYLALCPDVNFTDGTVTNSSIYDIQIEKGSVITDYEPYIKQQIINIKAKEPLRKIGAYADTLNLKTKQVVRKIASEFITNVQTMSSEVSTYKKFLTDITYKPLITNVSSSYLGYAISNKFKQSTLVYSQMGTKPNLIQSYITTGGVSRCVYTFDDASVQTVTAAQPLIGDGFEVCYVMASNIIENIEVPEIKAGKNTKFEFDTLEPSSFSVTAFEDYEVSLI